MARAKHRWRREQDQMDALINRVERKRKQEEMMEEHRNIKKAGLRLTPVEVTSETE
jgi:hypothetical protein